METKFHFDDNVVDEDRADFARLCDRELSKILRFFDDVQEVVLTLRTYEREGARQKYSFHIRVFTGGKPVVAEYADWKLTDCVHKVFASLRAQVAE